MMLMPLGKTKKEDFKDPMIYEYLVNFFKEETRDRDSIVIRSEVNTKLVPLFNTMTLSRITSEWVVHLEENDKFPIGGKALFSRFIGFLIEADNSLDSKLNRIVECKIRFYKSVKQGDFKILFESKIYNEFKENYCLSKSSSVSLLLADFEKTESESLNTFFKEYVENFKIEDKSVVRMKREKIYTINNIIRMFYAEVDIESMDNDDVIMFIKSEKIKNLRITIFLDILIELSKDELIQDGLLRKSINKIAKIQLVHSLYIDTPTLIYLLTNFKSYTVLHIDKRLDGSKRIVRISIKNPEIRNQIISYIDTLEVEVGPLKKFINNFSKSIQEKEINSINDLDYDVFSSQIKYYKQNFNTSLGIRLLIDFYQFLLNCQSPVLNDLTDHRFLNRTMLPDELYEGYKFLFYQPLEAIPSSDKWILSYTESQCTNSGISPSMTLGLDFSKIKYKKLRYPLKHYFWNYDSSISTKMTNYNSIIQFLNFISTYSKNNILPFNKENSEDIDITLNKIIGYCSFILSKYSNNATIAFEIYVVREFLNHVNSHQLLNVEKGYKYYLNYSRGTSNNEANPIKEDDLNKITKEIKKRANQSDLKKLYMIIFYLLITTELRPSNVVSLRKDCVQTNKQNQYVIRTETKTSNKEIVNVPITLEIKKQIDEAIKITESIRIKNNDIETNNYLFIRERRLQETYGVISLQQFNLYLKKICRELNIPEYTASNLRDTHMTKAEEFIIGKNYSDIQKNVITGHKSSSVTEKHYIKKNLRNALKAADGITIGEESTSTIESSRSWKKEFPYNEVLIDEYFITTPDNLLYFKEELERIKIEIEGCKSIEQMTKLMNYQVLVQGYIDKIKEKTTKK